jgi:hypothetical protein
MSLSVLLAITLFNSPTLSPDYVPHETKIALVPVVNMSGETNPNGKEKQSSRGDEELHALFAERDFTILPDEAVKAAIQELHFDLSDEEQQKRETLYKIGKKTGADLVVFLAITDVDQRKVAKVFVTSTEGSAKMKLWIVDAKQESAIISGKSIRGSSKSGGWVEIGEKGSSRKQLAVANGLRDNTKDFFKPYPVVKKIERSKVN